MYSINKPERSLVGDKILKGPVILREACIVSGADTGYARGCRAATVNDTRERGTCHTAHCTGGLPTGRG